MTAFPWFFWLFLLLLLPMAIWWYGVQARRVSRRIRAWASRSKRRFLAAVRRRVRVLLADDGAVEFEEEVTRPAELHPRS